MTEPLRRTDLPYRRMGVVYCDRRADRPLDRGRSDESGQDQYNRNGGALYPDDPAVQSHFLRGFGCRRRHEQ